MMKLAGNIKTQNGTHSGKKDVLKSLRYRNGMEVNRIKC